MENENSFHQDTESVQENTQKETHTMASSLQV